jgi:O-antigen/teichoic acid export membrane protein
MLFLQVPVFVVGKVRSLSELGMYTLAVGLAQVPTMAFDRAVWPTLMPAFAEVKADPERLRRTILAAVRAAAVLGMPVAGFLVVFAGPVLSVAYGKAYAKAGPVLALLSVLTALTMVNGCLVSALFATGSPGACRVPLLVRLGLLVALIVPGVRLLGVVGAPAALLVAQSSMLLFLAVRVRKLLLIPEWAVLRELSRGVRLGMVTAVLCLGFRMVSREAVLLELGVGAVACMVTLGMGLFRALVARPEL